MNQASLKREPSIEEVAIRCQACGERCELADAVKRGWRACQHCGSFVCGECLGLLGENFRCLSAVCMDAGRHFESQPIPVDRVLVFARAQQVLAMEDSFLFRVFFEDDIHHGHDDYTLQAQEPENASRASDEDNPAKIQMETWQGHRLVLTRRRHGRFVSWERVC